MASSEQEVAAIPILSSQFVYAGVVMDLTVSENSSSSTNNDNLPLVSYNKFRCSPQIQYTNHPHTYMTFSMDMTREVKQKDNMDSLTTTTKTLEF